MDEKDARRLPNRVNLVWGYPRKPKKHESKQIECLFDSIPVLGVILEEIWIGSWDFFAFYTICRRY